MSDGKRCSRCSLFQPPSCFYRDPRSKDGLRPDCKDCHRRGVLRWRALNRDKVHAMAAASRARCAAHISESQARYREENHERIMERQRRQRAADRRKDRSRDAVRRAMRRGELVKPAACQRCHRVGFVEASHNDYNLPLVVEWLCKSCHQRKDRANAARSAA